MTASVTQELTLVYFRKEPRQRPVGDLRDVAQLGGWVDMIEIEVLGSPAAGALAAKTFSG